MTITTALVCRGCRRAVDTGTPVFAGAIAFTCSNCLMTGADSPPIWDAQCDYNVAEAKEAFSARAAAGEGNHSAPASRPREIGSVAESCSVSAVTVSSPSGRSTNKTSRDGRPRVDPASKRARAAARQRAYRRGRGAV